MPPKSANQKQCLNWTRAMDDYLVNAFMEQYNCGYKLNGQFTYTAYDNIVKEMSALLDVEMDKDKIKNRWKTLKKNFSEVYDVFKNGLSGFGWNATSHMWEAEDEVWDSLIESKPQAANWRNVSIPNYDKMIILYGNDRASGEGTRTLGEMRKRPHTLNEADLFDVDNNIDNVDSHHDINVDNVEALDNSTTQDNSPGVASGTSRKKQKVNSKKGTDSDLLELKDVIYEVSQAINVGNQAMIASNEALNGANAMARELNEIARERNQIAKEASRKLPQLSGEEIWKLIQDCGFSTTNVTKIYRVLMGDGDLLRTFVECPLLARKDLLMDVMKDLK